MNYFPCLLHVYYRLTEDMPTLFFKPTKSELFVYIQNTYGGVQTGL